MTGAKPGRVSSDGEFHVERVECQGACTAAPMLVLDGVFHENLAKPDVERVLAGAARAAGSPRAERVPGGAR